MKMCVSKNPTKPIPAIYSRVRTNFCREIEDQEEKWNFMNEFPSYRNFKKQLYGERRKQIPATPGSQVKSFLG